MKTATATLLHLCLALPAVATATTFNRCEAASGDVTFTQLACPPGDEHSRQRAHNASPGGDSRIPMAMPEPTRQTRAPRPPAPATVKNPRQPAAAKAVKAQPPASTKETRETEKKNKKKKTGKFVGPKELEQLRSRKAKSPHR